MDLPEYEQPPIARPPVKVSQYETDHIPEFTDTKRNYKVCYMKFKKEMKVRSYCRAPQCNVYLHCMKGFGCFSVWHDNSFHK